jgi:uncharacterized damage-inducible protein DinB
MSRTLESYINEIREESHITQSILDSLSDASLRQEVSPLDRTLGQIAWHIVTSIYTIMSIAELSIPSPGNKNDVPATAKHIAEAYHKTSSALISALQTDWNDETLLETRNMYDMKWPVTQVLDILIKHEIHHRGQLSILMRQANLHVPDIYGPARRG